METHDTPPEIAALTAQLAEYASKNGYREIVIAKNGAVTMQRGERYKINRAATPLQWIGLGWAALITAISMGFALLLAVSFMPPVGYGLPIILMFAPWLCASVVVAGAFGEHLFTDGLAYPLSGVFLGLALMSEMWPVTVLFVAMALSCAIIYTRHSIARKFDRWFHPRRRDAATS